MIWKPFTLDVWIAFWISQLFYSLVLTGISYLSKKCIARSTTTEPSSTTSSSSSLSSSSTSSWLSSCFSSSPKHEDFTFLESLWYFSLGSLQLGPDKQPVTFAGKFLQQSWSLLLLVLVAAYTANLSAIFSADSLVKQLKSIDDLSRHPGQKIVARRDYKSQFVSFNNSILNELLRRNASIEFANVSKGEQDKFFADVTKKLNSDYVWIEFSWQNDGFCNQNRSKRNRNLTF